MASTTALYSRDRQRPAALPFRVRLPSGLTRTNPHTFTDAELAEWGFVGPYSVPEFDPDNQRLTWDSELLAYEIVELTPEEKDARYNAKADWNTFYIEVTSSDLYNHVRSVAFEFPALNIDVTEFLAALTDARYGTANLEAVNTAVTHLFGTLIALDRFFTEEQLAELQGILVACHLDRLVQLPELSVEEED